MMHWTCDGCGACCIGFTVRARATGDYADGSDGYAVNAALKKRRLPLVDQDGMMPKTKGACAALDVSKRSCRIYDNRPWVCGAFLIGSPACVTARIIAGIDTVPDPVEWLRRSGDVLRRIEVDAFPADYVSAFIDFFKAHGDTANAARLEGWVLEAAARRRKARELEMPDHTAPEELIVAKRARYAVSVR